MGDVGDEPLREGLSLLVRATVDGRLLAPSVALLHQARAFWALEGARRVALELCDLRAVTLLSTLPGERGAPLVDEATLHAWFVARGALLFDVYRDAQRGVARVKDDDAALLRQTASRLGLPRSFLAEAAGRASPERAALLALMARGEPAEVRLARPPISAGDALSSLLARSGAWGLSLLQSPASGPSQQSLVRAAIGDDGVALVYKHLPAPTSRLSHLLCDEAATLEALSALPFLPRSLGVVEPSPGLRFLKLSFRPGQPLSRQLDARPTRDEARAIIGAVASMLSALHARGFLYRDMRPENVLVHPDEPTLLDLGAACPATLAASPPFDPRFVAPETALSLEASPASDVFALGVLTHLLLTGQHPFAPPDSPLSASPRAAALARFATAALLDPPRPAGDDEAAQLTRRMLARAPHERPSAAEVAALFDVHPRARYRLAPSRLSRPIEGGAVLFPARMGVPHRGHIDFVARLCELGFHVIVSLQKAYTRGPDDPIDKHLVMKMVARSLQTRGIDTSSFSFMLTPFFATRAQHRLHFAMMPGREHVRAVASGNPEVHALLDDLRPLGQETVFAVPGEPYQPRSWGARLRAAIRARDRALFEELAAPGVLEVLPWPELCAALELAPIPFVRGHVRVTLSRDGETLVAGRVRRYAGPEQTLVMLLGDAGHRARLEGPFERAPTLWLDGEKTRLGFVAMTAHGDDVVLSFTLS